IAAQRPNQTQAHYHFDCARAARIGSGTHQRWQSRDHHGWAEWSSETEEQFSWDTAENFVSLIGSEIEVFLELPEIASRGRLLPAPSDGHFLSSDFRLHIKQ